MQQGKAAGEVVAAAAMVKGVGEGMEEATKVGREGEGTEVVGKEGEGVEVETAGMVAMMAVRGAVVAARVAMEVRVAQAVVREACTCMRRADPPLRPLPPGRPRCICIHSGPTGCASAACHKPRGTRFSPHVYQLHSHVVESVGFMYHLQLASLTEAAAQHPSTFCQTS